MSRTLFLLAGLGILLVPNPAWSESNQELVRSIQSGKWSSPATWENGSVPGEGARVQVRAGHVVTYDVQSDKQIRFVHVAGTLSFAHDRDTRLDVGVIKIEATDDPSETGFDCDAHLSPPDPGVPRAILEIGSPIQPIQSGHSALIRLVYIEGMDKKSCPAIVCCGGRMDFHGAELEHTWVKLGAAVKAGDSEITVAESVAGWRAGDRVIVTATTRQNKIKKTFRSSVRDSSQTEVRFIQSIRERRVVLDRPLDFDHIAEGGFRGEIANLSRNIIVESANPEIARGHTMYHRYSAGSISYAEFRHLGKEGVLGRYSLHYHRVGDTMRGSSVIGASIWDSGNRWLTIHGTNYLVVRDCVGYQSVGHGYFLEDGTEVYNVLDHNLAVQAYIGRPLPEQVLPFDKNDGSGFWWANSRNTFTSNVACECDEYGYFFQATKTADFDPVLTVQRPDGSYEQVDIRTLPLIRFDGNESHCQRRHSFNLGGGVPFGPPNVDGVGPDSQHPFVIRNLKLWDVHWGIHPVSPSVFLDHVEIHNAEYGIWRPVYNQHFYRDIVMTNVPEKTRYAFTDGSPNDALAYPSGFSQIDDFPPTTVITHVRRSNDHEVVLRGTASDNSEIKLLRVNGHLATPTAPNFAQWEVTIPAPPGQLRLEAQSQDVVGNREPRPHVVEWCDD